LNDALTHVDHCGSALRREENLQLDAIAAELPESFMGVPVEYDVTYESPAGTITGYRYTDFLTTCVGVYPCNSAMVSSTLCGLVHCEARQVGYAVMEQMKAALQDKYVLRSNARTPAEIVVLPGSNMLRRNVVDWDKVRQAVRHGAQIKPHPVTSNPELFKIRQEYGDRVLPHDASLYSMLAGCDVLHFTSTSEIGLAAAMLGKTANLIDTKDCDVLPNFHGVYRALGEKVHGKTTADKLATLLSYPQSGLFSVFHPDMPQWINRFFMHYQRVPHGRGVCVMADDLA
jgi:hypothetical protein